ncbi:MAG: hypothetical protein VKJ06_03745 [Vampirovibrionales bacterium]|nr:hypothetical protein [Vampirovibrionales bacterium]
MQAHLAQSIPVSQWPQAYAQSLGQNAQTLSRGVEGRPVNDPELAALSDNLKRGSSLMIASLISGGTMGKPMAGRELLGFAGWYAAMAATPRLRNILTRLTTGLPMGQTFVSTQGERQRVFNESSRIPRHLLPQSMQQRVARRINDTLDNVQDSMQKISAQAETAWLLAAGPLTPVLASALNHVTAEPIGRGVHALQKALPASPEIQLKRLAGEGTSDLTHWWHDFDRALTRGLNLGSLKHGLQSTPQQLAQHLHSLGQHPEQLAHAKTLFETQRTNINAIVSQSTPLIEKSNSEAGRAAEHAISGARNSLRRYRYLLEKLPTLSKAQIETALNGNTLAEFQKMITAGRFKTAMAMLGDCPDATNTLAAALRGRKFNEAFKRFGVHPAKHLQQLAEASLRTRLWRTRYLGMLGGGVAASWALYSALAPKKSPPAQHQHVTSANATNLNQLTQDPKMQKALHSAAQNGSLDVGVLSQMPAAEGFKLLQAKPMDTANAPRFGQTPFVPGMGSFTPAMPLNTQPRLAFAPPLQDARRIAGAPAAGYDAPIQNYNSVAGASAAGYDTPFKNTPAMPLKRMLQKNQAQIYAINIRTFAAQDKNGDGKFDWQMGETGTFLNAINRLDELKAMGINTIHLLPIVDSADMLKYGNAGSVYAAENMHRVNPQFVSPQEQAAFAATHNGQKLTPELAARMFVDACHARGIAVMADVPSCAGLDLAIAKPELIELDKQGHFKIPNNWVDILMMKPDGPEVRQYFDGFFKLMANGLGVDGFRADVARARTDDFWRWAIGQYPNHGWLGETYTEETSAINNIPADRPAELLKAGFDNVYGQFHIFHNLHSADDYIQYLTNAYEHELLPAAQAGRGGKSLLGSFYTHDDHSSFNVGGPLLMLLQAGLMASQPWTTPYVIDGQQTGDPKDLDIFNFGPRPGGNNPEIAAMMQHLFTLRNSTAPSAPFMTNAAPGAPAIGDVLRSGAFIPLPVSKPRDGANQIIAFARHLNGKTVLVLANKDLNARSAGKITLPGALPGMAMARLTPAYGQPSQIKLNEVGALSVDLAPGTFHMFEVALPNLPINAANAGLKAYPGVLG